MTETLFNMFSPDFPLRNSLYASLLIGCVCPLVGTHFLLRRMVFLGVALPQLSSAGIAFAFFLHALGLHPFPHQEQEQALALSGSITFVLTALFLLAFLERKERGLLEGHMSVTYAAAAAASILFVAANPFGEAEILSLLKGEVLALPDPIFAHVVGTYTVIALCMCLFHKEFVLVSFDRDMAITLHKNVLAWDLFFYLLIGITVTFGVMTVGPLLIFGLLVIPPLTARLITKGMRSFTLISSLIGGLSALGGFYLSLLLDLPLGPTDVAVACILLFVALSIQSTWRWIIRPSKKEATQPR